MKAGYRWEEERLIMKKLTNELYDELLKMKKITGSDEISVVMMRAMNNALLAGASPELIIKRLRRMEIETHDSLSTTKVSDL